MNRMLHTVVGSTAVHARIAALLLAAILLGACGGSKGVVNDAADVLSRVEKSYKSTPNMTMKGTMKISGVRATIWFETYAKQYDSLKMVLTGPFGISVGALGSTPAHFTFLELFQDNIAYEGRPDRETFTKAMQLGLGYREIVALMRCEVPHIPTASDMNAGTLTIRDEGNLIHYTIPQGDVTETFTVDPKKLVITAYTLKRTYGAEEVTELDVTYKDFYIKTQGRYFPQEATAVLNDGQQTLRISVDQVKSSIEGETTLAVEVPAGMERRTL